MDPSKPLVVSVEIESPHVVVYRLFFKRPGDGQFTTFATGNDEPDSNRSLHRHQVGPLPAGSQLAWSFLFSGNPNTTFRVEVDVRQGGDSLPGMPDVLDGVTDASGVAGKEGGLTL